MRSPLPAWSKRLSPAHIRAGQSWYHNAHAFARAVASKYDIPLDRVCGVIACLSVQNRWEQNKIDTENLCRTYQEGAPFDQMTVGTYKLQKDKAIAILTTEEDNPDIPTMVGTKYACKTRAFYDNILRPDESTEVTLDRWLFRALGLERYLEGGGNRYVALYRKLVKAFREEADRMDMLPSVLQAAIWHCVQSVADVEDWAGTRPGSGLILEENTPDPDIAPF